MKTKILMGLAGLGMLAGVASGVLLVRERLAHASGPQPVNFGSCFTWWGNPVTPVSTNGGNWLPFQFNNPDGSKNPGMGCVEPNGGRVFVLAQSAAGIKWTLVDAFGVNP